MAIIWVPGIVGLTTAHNATVCVQPDVILIALLIAILCVDLGCETHLVEHLVKCGMGRYVLQMSIHLLCLTTHRRLVDCPGGVVSATRLPLRLSV